MNFKKIESQGNLPRHLKVLAKQLGGTYSKSYSEFFETSSIAEFEKSAYEIGYEIVPTIDTESGRGFLVGFSVSDPKRVSTFDSYVKLDIYFVACSSKEVEEWTKRIKKHRLAQEKDMQRRRTKAQMKLSKSTLKILN
jgi:hypothetical protein